MSHVNDKAKYTDDPYQPILLVHESLIITYRFLISSR